MASNTGSALQHGADQPVLGGEGAGEKLLLETRLGGRHDLGVKADVVAVDAGLRVAGRDTDPSLRRVSAGQRLREARLELDGAGGEARRLDVGDVVGGHSLTRREAANGSLQRQRCNVVEHGDDSSANAPIRRLSVSVRARDPYRPPSTKPLANKHTIGSYVLRHAPSRTRDFARQQWVPNRMTDSSYTWPDRPLGPQRTRGPGQTRRSR